MYTLGAPESRKVYFPQGFQLAGIGEAPLDFAESEPRRARKQSSFERREAAIEKIDETNTVPLPFSAHIMKKRAHAKTTTPGPRPKSLPPVMDKKAKRTVYSRVSPKVLNKEIEIKKWMRQRIEPSRLVQTAVVDKSKRSEISRNTQKARTLSSWHTPHKSVQEGARQEDITEFLNTSYPMPRAATPFSTFAPISVATKDINTRREISHLEKLLDEKEINFFNSQLTHHL